MLSRSDLAFLDELVANEELANEVLCEMATSPRELLLRVTEDRAIQTDAMARRLLEHARAIRGAADPDTLSLFVEAALTALSLGGSTNHDLLVQSWLDKANSRMQRGHYSDAEAAIDRARFHATRTCHPAFYENHVNHSLAGLLYVTHRTTECAVVLSRVIETFEQLGDPARAAYARKLMVCVQIEQNHHGAALEHLRVEARMAHAQRDHAELARIYSAIGSCMFDKGLASVGEGDEADRHVEAAREAVNLSLYYARNLGLEIHEARIERLDALLTMYTDGADAGLRQMDVVRERCRSLKMSGESVICLIDAVDALAIIDKWHEEIPRLCRRIQVEAGALSLRVAVADATERLRVAALRHAITHDMTADLRAKIEPCAKLAAEEVAN